MTISGPLSIIRAMSLYQQSITEYCERVGDGWIDQFEDLETGLRREVAEETGLTELEIKKMLTNWHIFRGPKSAHNEVIGITFICQTPQTEVKLSFEHSRYQWVDPAQAVKMISIPGIKRDVEAYLKTIR